MTVDEFILQEQARLEELRLEIVEIERFTRRPVTHSDSSWQLLLNPDAALETIYDDDEEVEEA